MKKGEIYYNPTMNIYFMHGTGYSFSSRAKAIKFKKLYNRKLILIKELDNINEKIRMLSV
jgi:ABC-type transport system involved in cytochrome c biogenesis permease subunit